MIESGNSKKLVSIVSPVYMGEYLVKPLVEAIDRAMIRFDGNYEIVLVEDGSGDRGWQAILDICKINPRVKGVKLSRNFGQHKAITAGLRAARGEWYVVMDCDLQDRPEEIGKLYDKAMEGYEIVLGQRITRQDGHLKKLFSKLFYKGLSWLTGSSFDSSIANFGIYGEKVIDSIAAMNEPIRFFPVMVKWCGFRSTSIEVSHGSRVEGKSSYDFMRLCSLGLDIVLANSDKPLRIAVGLGLMMSVLSVLLTLLVIGRALTYGFEVMGYASLVCLLLFCTGLIVFILGVVGLYIGKIFEATKQRPIYLVEEKVNFE